MNKAMAGVTLAAVISASGAQAQEGPTELDKCQTISQSGSYKLVNNLTFTGPSGSACLPITVSNVTIDLAGFSIISLVRVHKGVFFSGVARAERHERDGRRAHFAQW